MSACITRLEAKVFFMRRTSLFSLTLVPIGLLSWHGVNRLNLPASEAATIGTEAGTETTDLESLRQSESEGSAYSPVLLPAAGQSEVLAQPSFSAGRALANQHLANQHLANQGSTTQGSPLPFSPLPSSPLPFEAISSVSTQTSQPFSLGLDRAQLKSVVGRAVGDRSPVLVAAAETTAETAAETFDEIPDLSRFQPSVQYAFYNQPSESQSLDNPASESQISESQISGSPESEAQMFEGQSFESPTISATLASVDARPVAQFTQVRTPKDTAQDTAQDTQIKAATAGSQALAAAIAHRALTPALTSEGTAPAAAVAPAFTRPNTAQTIAQIPTLNPATPSSPQTAPRAEPPAGNSPSNAPSMRTEPANNTGQPNGSSVNTGPLTPGLFNTGIVSTGVDENYILGPGDIIEVIVFNVPEYSGQHRISTSGTINLPLIGRTAVRGMSLDQAGDAIAARYVSQLQTPLVSINVLQQRPMQIAIAGEISQPGLYTLVADGAAYPRIFEALQQAGGLTQAANLKQVEVRRQGSDGRLTTLSVDLLALLQNGDISQNIFLQDGDAIVISSATAIDQAALDNLSASNLRPNRDQPPVNDHFLNKS